MRSPLTGGQLAERLYATVGWALAGAATILASSGQLEFARMAGITDVRRFLVPAIFEIAVVFVLAGGYLRACAGESPTLRWALAGLITFFAGWANLNHRGTQAGRIFAVATMLTFMLWLLHLRDRYRRVQRAAGHLDAPTDRFRLVRWVVTPRLTLRAWLIAVDFGLADPESALHWARAWFEIVAAAPRRLHGSGRRNRRHARRMATLTIQRRIHQTGPDSCCHCAAIPTGNDVGSAVAPVGFQPGRASIGPGRADLADTLTDLPPVGTACVEPIRAYVPIGEDDAAMFRVWLAGVQAGQEPSSGDLARAIGRASDVHGEGGRAQQRYRHAHAMPSQPSQPREPSPTVEAVFNPAA